MSKEEKIAYAVAVSILCVLYIGVLTESMLFTLLGMALLMTLPLASYINNSIIKK